MRDLTTNKVQEDNAETGLTQTRETDCILKGEEVHIEDITSSKVQIIDNFEKVLKCVE